MRILFCGGGTGGHISPALAIADIIKEKDKKAELAFVGRDGGAENAPIVKEGYRLFTLDIAGIRRSLSPSNVKAIVKAVRATRRAKDILKDFSPDVIIGTGGYVSWPVLRAGIKKGIPTLLHESNAYPGLVTRMLGHRCTHVLLNYSCAGEHLKATGNVTVVGNPIRGKFERLTYEGARRQLGIGKDEFFIVSFGGSLGAEVLNDNAIELMKLYSSKTLKTRHIHATGRKNYEKIKAATPSLCRGDRGCKILPYIEDMPTYLTAADVAITRSGAMTVSELAAARTPAILIPSPNVAANHQYENARQIADVGGAVLIEEDKLSSELLQKEIEAIRNSPVKRASMKRAIAGFHDRSTAKKILTVIEYAAAKKQQ